ncbi:ABC transporter ATP-binding protein YxdL [subsurface metagenome]
MVEMVDLFKDYKVGKVLFPALRGISLKIEDGEFTAIAGPSGSGKTTLLNIIGCLDIPTKGDVLINGTSIPVLTAYENVEMPLILVNMPAEEKKERVISILEEVGLEEFVHRKSNEMSGGQQQRVAIARALVKKPSMVLADEPTANLDSMNAKEILLLMKELNKKKKTTFIFSTHDQLVMEFAERIIYLRDGKIASDKKK